MWLADDSPLEAAHTRDLLSEACHVETFADGSALLERLAQAGVEPPRLLVLDWRMPGVSGLEVCRFVRERFSPSALPILVLTASSDEKDLEQAFSAGANDHVVKPARPTELRARVGALLQLRAHEEERQRLLAEVEAARVRVTSLFDRAPAIICAFRGPELVYELSNPLHQRLVGKGRQLVGRPVRDAVPEALDPGVVALLERVYRTGVPHVGREMPARVDRSGSGAVEDASYDQVYQPVRRPGAALADVLILTHDVTDKVRARQEAERLVALEKERAGFEQQLIGIVSHDLRNPIAAILMGAAVLLRRPDVEERQRRTLERILASAGRANRLIHDLLDSTQARLGGGLRARPAPGDFHAVVRQVLEESQVSNPGRTLRLTQTGVGAGAFDADRVAQLTGNLLSNALHYSPGVLRTLFQPMQRGVGEGGVSEVRSVGLGLYIVDQVARAHGGRVEVTSTAGAGTTFTVRLPRSPGGA